ncbi:uncharacterized protein B0T23DRAFT_389240 [Neurospora hispaniola]|uniref:Uncharacterized protein n=1 Tax=Neurospora hispaniola TaxID=588809 RepID=A0AAJ0MML3_9PEZI|nr:hypothetical protein B0T23DRAFT_389240 [Neurospora hispaniola]
MRARLVVGSVTTSESLVFYAYIYSYGEVIVLVTNLTMTSFSASMLHPEWVPFVAIWSLAILATCTVLPPTVQPFAHTWILSIKP